jgi:hypothetical protein
LCSVRTEPRLFEKVGVLAVMVGILAAMASRLDLSQIN